MSHVPALGTGKLVQPLIHCRRADPGRRANVEESWLNSISDVGRLVQIFRYSDWCRYRESGVPDECLTMPHSP